MPAAQLAARNDGVIVSRLLSPTGQAGRTGLRKTLALAAVAALSACQAEFPEGSPLNPIRMFFVTSSEVSAVKDSSERVARHLAKATGLDIVPVVSSGYVAVIEGLGTADADLAFLPTNAYIKASERFGAEVALVVVRAGNQKHYRAQFIARADANIHTLEDLAGKVWGYADTNSTSGYTIPAQMLANRGIRVREEKTTGTHPNTVQQVYDSQVDVGTTYWSPGGKDAREKLLVTHPDVFERVKIVSLTDEIPNDTVTFRRGFDPEMKQRITEALKQYAATAEGKNALDQMYQIEGLDDVDEAFYADFRRLLKGEATKPAAPPTDLAGTSSKGSAFDPYRVALGAASPAEVVNAASPPGPVAYVIEPGPVGRSPLARLADGSADVALLDWPTASSALVAGHTPMAIAQLSGGTTTRRIVALRRRSALANGLVGIGSRTEVRVIQSANASVDALGELALARAYARTLGAREPLVIDAPDDAAELVIMLEALDLGAAPPWRNDFEPVAYSVPFPHAVAVASKLLAPTAFRRLRELVLSGALRFPGAWGFSPAPVAALTDSARHAMGKLDLAYVPPKKGARGGARPFPGIAEDQALGFGWWMKHLVPVAKNP